MDRVEITRQLYRELAPEDRPSQSTAFLNSSRYYAPNWSDYRYRPALARRLLEQAGCRRGQDGIYSCDGARLSLRFYTTAGALGRARALELLEPQLRRVGIEARVSFVQGTPLFTQVLPSGAFDVVLAAQFVRGTIAHKSLYGCGGPENFTGYCQRLVTGNLDQADRTLDAPQRARVLNRVDRQLARDVPVIPLYEPPWVIAYRTKVRNVVVSPDNLLWNAENWWVER
jgi:peptide/nickel transport system substrate-binding protein